jgi:hypothetical protein
MVFWLGQLGGARCRMMQGYGRQGVTHARPLSSHPPANLIVVLASCMQMLAAFGSKAFLRTAPTELRTSTTLTGVRAEESACRHACAMHMNAQDRNALGRKCMHTCVCTHAFVTTRICCEAFKVLLYFKKQLHTSRKHSKQNACLRSFPPRVCMHACYSLHIGSSLSSRNVNSL